MKALAIPKVEYLLARASIISCLAGGNDVGNGGDVDDTFSPSSPHELSNYLTFTYSNQKFNEKKRGVS